MIVICEESDGRDIGIRIEGKITREDYAQVLPRIERAIEEHGKARLLIHLQSVGGMEFGAFWDDLKFSLKHIRHFERVAFVGSRNWHKALLGVARTLTPGETRYFPSTEIDEAWCWLKSTAPAAVT